LDFAVTEMLDGYFSGRTAITTGNFFCQVLRACTREDFGYSFHKMIIAAKILLKLKAQSVKRKAFLKQPRGLDFIMIQSPKIGFARYALSFTLQKKHLSVL
jgi:hypothetical protein